MAPAKKKQKLSNGSVAAIEVPEDAGADKHTSETQDEKPGQQSRSLFVRSLPASTTSEALTELFSESYPIRHATAVVDTTTKQCRGYGFVTFADAEDAQRAKEEFNGFAFDGRKLRIETAEPRHRDAEDVGDAGTGKAVPTKRQRDMPQPSRLIVRNLPWTIKTSNQLAKLFMSYGKIKQAYIPQKGPGLMAGFGFVVLRGRKNAEKALEGTNGKEVDGRTLAVDWAVSKDVYDNLLERDTTALLPTQDREQTSPLDVDVDDASKDAAAEDGDGLLNEHDHPMASSVEGESADLEDQDEDDVDIEVEGGDSKPEDRSLTLFVRNLPFTCTDEDLEDHFTRFGSTRYARIVVDPGTGRSKGTGFVCFYKNADADACLRGAPKQMLPPASKDPQGLKAAPMSSSILQNEDADPSGQYTMDGRVLQISRAVDKSEANRLTQEGAAHRHKHNEDKRRIYLLSEGTISSNSGLWEKLSPSERIMREASAKQRKSLIEGNPSLHLSLTRLSVRNIPRNFDSKELKILAREAVVGFATDVKAETRHKLSKEELARGGEEMQDMEKARKRAGKGLVRQAKVVFEGAGGSKVGEDSGAGRSRGYGFIEYHTHRSALMGLRWLNGHAVGHQVKDGKKAKANLGGVQDRKKRLIVEFAIENAQVVMRRKDREKKARSRSEAVKQGIDTEDRAGENSTGDKTRQKPDTRNRNRGSEKRSRASELKPKKGYDKRPRSKPAGTGSLQDQPKQPIDERLARRNQIIGRKRAMRRTRKGA